MRSVFIGFVLLSSGCGAAASQRTTPPTAREVIQMEELRITARPTEDGFDLDSYDAETLFARATDLLNRQRCPEAVTLYDRLADEFPTSRYRSPGLYNAGLCLQDTGDGPRAVLRYERLLREEPRSPDVKHASLQLAKLRVELEQWAEGLRVSDALLARDDLSSEERVEAMARRAQCLLGAERLEDAARQARTTLTFYRTRGPDERVRDEFFAAAANFVLAETVRLRAARITIPQAAVEQQRSLLEGRAQLMLEAQREYFNTISLTNAHWAAASGYRIGSMYGALWEAISRAPTPPPPATLPPGTQAVFEQEYRQELARTIKPLIRNAIRFWELTMMMVERTGVRSEWAERLQADLEVARARLLEADGGSAPVDGTPPGPAAGTGDRGTETAEGLSSPGRL